MKRSYSFPPYLNFLLALLILILYIMPFFARGAVRILYARAGYYLTLLLVLSWAGVIVQCLRRYKPNVRSFIKSYGYGLILAAAISFIIFFSVKSQFRILYDETNLLSISKSMFYERKIENVVTGLWYYDSFHPIAGALDKRPLVFPFFTYVIHTMLGYHAANAFILNIFVLFILLFLIYMQAKNYLGNDIWASCAVILVASQPIVAQTARSGGFDLLAALFLVICFACLRWFLRNPETTRFQLLWVSLLMLANVRYEGIVFFAIVLSFICYFRYLKPAFFGSGMTVIYLFTPFILLNAYWPRFLISDTFESRGVVPFSLEHLLRNNAAFLKGIFDFGFTLPYASIVNIIGLAGLIYFSYLFFARRIPRELHERRSISIAFVCIIAYWILITSYYVSNVYNPVASRLFIIFLILLSVLTVMLARESRLFKRRPIYILLFSLAIFLLYHPVSVKDWFHNRSLLPREYVLMQDFLKRECGEDRNILIITENPGLYTVQNYGAITFQDANSSNALAAQYNGRLFENIFVLQRIMYKTMAPKPEDRLAEKFVLEKVFELQNDPDHFVRISKVSSIR